MIYLDNAATTKIDDRVLEAMMPYLKDQYGNPSSKHYHIANKAENAVKKSRRNVASLINADKDEIIFTSGATESNNFIIKGVAEKYKNKGNHIITSAIEHKSIIETCKYLEKNGFEVTYIKPNDKGRISFKKVKESINDNTILISIIWANNELGTKNSIDRICNVANSNSILFHTDATQVIGKNEVNAKKVLFDFISFSGHKIYGPKGIGIAYLRKDELGLRKKITPLIHGGEQEFNLRAGTLPVHNIVGIGEAAKIAEKERKNYMPKIIELEKIFKKELKKINDDIAINGDQSDKIPGIINVTIPGINNEFFIKKFKDKFALSTGSACSITEPSHVLKAIGLNESEIMSTLRISISKYNNLSDIKSFVSKIKKIL